jgi:hypothetical protein
MSNNQEGKTPRMIALEIWPKKHLTILAEIPILTHRGKNAKKS